MPKKRAASAVPEVCGPDIREQVKAESIARANAELPEDIRRLSPRECLDRLRQMGGYARLLRLREPGDDDEEVA